MGLILSDLSYRYGRHSAINSISCSFGDGDFVAIIGQNGSGKSTLLRCINRVLIPTSGAVYIDNDLQKSMSMQQIAERVAYVPQYSDGDIYATVFESVLLGRRPYIDGAPKQIDYDKVAQAIVQMGLEELAMRRVGTLSGGERQRVMIARAIAQSTKTILLDEPTSSLDVKHQFGLMNYLRQLAKQGKTIVVTLHDLMMATQFCNKVLMLKHGKVFCYGTPELCTSERMRQLYDINFDIDIKPKKM